MIEKVAFIVCGAEYSGNRLVAGILASGGCWGRGSDRQPKRDEVPTDVEHIVVIAHLADDILAWQRHFERHHYRIHYVLTARDPWVQVRSRSKAAGCSHEESMKRYWEDYHAAFERIATSCCGFTVVPYESLLWPGAVKRFLSLFGLTQTHPLKVQGEVTTIRDENGKWYA